MLQEKNREVEWLRAQKAVDDVSDLWGVDLGVVSDFVDFSQREREAKVRQLTGKA